MNTVVKNKQNVIKIYLEQAQLLVKKNNIQQAIAIYQEAIKICPRHFRPYYEVAELLKRFPDFTQAIPYYKQVISLNAQWFKPYYELACIELHCKNIDLAINYFQQAIKLQPDYLWSYIDLGAIYYKLNKIDLAINCYQKCIGIKPDCYLAWFNLGEIFRKQNDLDNAIANYRQALNIKPNEVKTFQKLQACLAQKSPEQYPDYQAYQLALHAGNKDDQYFYQLGKKLSKQGLIETAIACYLQVVKLNPKFSEVYETIYNSILYLDNCDNIIEAYQNILQQYPNLVIVKRNLSKIFSRQGNIDLAIEYNKQIASKKIINKNITNSSEKEYIRQPDFLIIGSEKCGTSSLYQYIVKHPQVISAIEKEIHFFTQYFNRGLDWYLSHFPSLPKDTNYITGEASTSYIACHNNAPQKVMQSFPEIKLLAVIRDPIDRAISHYHQLVRLGKEYRSFEEIVQIELEILGNIDNIWSIKQKYWSQDKGILWHSLYFYFVQQWLNIFPREQILILRSEDLFTNTQNTMNRVFNFLELDEFSQQKYQTYNSGGNYNQLDHHIIQKLQDFFDPHNKKLEELIGD